MKFIYLFSLLVGLCTIAQAQQSFKETMGIYNGRENTIPDFEAINGFDQDWLTYSGSGMQGTHNVSQSSGYTGASGWPDVYMTASQTFIIKGLTPSAPCSTAPTTVSFGSAFKSNLGNTSSTLNISYSTDGGVTWVAVNATSVTTSWVLRSVSVPGNTNAIQFQTPNIPFSLDFIAIDDVTISNTGAGCTLPVHLRTFTGEDSQLGVQLNWMTEMEQSNSHFIVERASDAKSFEAIARIAGEGTSTELHTYSYLDESAPKGFNYYRLKQVDISGTYAYSQIVAVRFEGNGIFRAYPNPTTSSLMFTIPKGVDAKTVQLYSSTGQLLASWLPDQPVSLATMASGRYLLYVRTTDGRLFTQWVVKAD